MKYYHATDYNNVESIMKEGLKKSPIDSVVYMCKKEDEALRFCTFRFWERTAVIEIDIPREFKYMVEEQFDHNQNFFKCRAWGFKADVPKEWLKLKNVYERRHD